MSEEVIARAAIAGDDLGAESAPFPVLVADSRGTVTTLNTLCAALLPAARPGCRLQDVVPDWLSEAHRGAHPAPTSGRLGTRLFTARPSLRPGAAVAWWLVDAGPAPHDSRSMVRAAVLDEASTDLAASLSVERCSEAVVRIAVRHLANAAILVGPVASDGRTPLVWGTPDGRIGRRAVAADLRGVPGLAEAMRGYPPVPSRWIDPEELPEWLVPEASSGSIGSVLITPLPGRGVSAGALVLLRRSPAEAFEDADNVLARLFAARAGAALSVSRLYADQCETTQTLMRELLPPTLRAVRGVELAGGYRACDTHRGVGGDFYDVFPAVRDDQETLVVLGDVCGRGLPAAVLTGRIRTTMHALAPLAGDHAAVLGRLNDALLTDDNSRLATLVLASIGHGDDVRLRLSCAGHPAPLVLRADGTVERPDTRGTLVGALPQFRVRSATTSLQPGDACVLFSDGVAESRNAEGEAFGVGRLAAALAECGGLPAEAIVERVMMLTDRWCGERHDDLAVVVIARPRAGRSRSPRGASGPAGRGGR